MTLTRSISPCTCVSALFYPVVAFTSCLVTTISVRDFDYDTKMYMCSRIRQNRRLTQNPQVYASILCMGRNPT